MFWPAPRRAGAVAVAGVAATLGACSVLVDTSNLDEGDDSPRPVPAEAQAGIPGDGSGSHFDSGLMTGCPSAPEQGLLAWYPFDEPDGTDAAVDCSGNERDGVLLPEAKFARAPGRSGRALDFNGTTSCFDVGFAPELASSGEPRTVAAWIKPRTFSLGGNPRAFFSHYISPGQSQGWWMATDEQSLLELKIHPADGGFHENESGIPTDRWVHVVGVVVPNELRVYVDGALQKKTAPTRSAAVNPLAHGYLGCAAGRFYFDGLVDDLRLYGRALTADEISALARK